MKLFTPNASLKIIEAIKPTKLDVFFGKFVIDFITPK